MGGSIVGVHRHQGIAITMLLIHHVERAIALRDTSALLCALMDRMMSFPARLVQWCGYWAKSAKMGLAPFQQLCLFITVLFTHCSHIRAKGSLSPAPPHARRTRDAALRRDSAEFYRCLRQGVTPNNRALRKRDHATRLYRPADYLDRAAA